MIKNNMTFIEASIEILKQNGNQPLSSREIWNKISEQNLVKTNGKTPWASLNTILIYHSRPDYKKNQKRTIYFSETSKNPIKFTILDLNTIHLEIEKEDTNIEETLEKSPLYSITSKELEWKKLTVYNNNENIEYELSDCNEYTYIIEDKAHATIKIGKTKNDPELRFNQLKTANPSIKLLHVFPSEQWSESDLHQKFGDIQKDLEWFFFTKGLRIFISEEMNKHGRMLFSYEKKKELDISEKMMLDII
jgi:hypothetical protein